MRDTILYSTADFDVRRAPPGRKGFEVYRNGVTGAERCAVIGYEGAKGLGRAIVECDDSRSGRERVVGMWAVNETAGPALDAALELLDNSDVRHYVSTKLGEHAALHHALQTGRNARSTIRPRTTRIWAHVARVLDRRVDLDRGGVVVRDGSASELVAELAMVLYGDVNALTNEEL